MMYNMGVFPQQRMAAAMPPQLTFGTVVAHGGGGYGGVQGMGIDAGQLLSLASMLNRMLPK